jgi:putative tricarboxylic transport membrane protein
MRKYGFPTAPVVLAIILGPMAELGFKRANLMAKDTPILQYYLSRPLSLILVALIVLSLFAPLVMGRIQKKKAVPGVEESGGDAGSDD